MKKTFQKITVVFSFILFSAVCLGQSSDENCKCEKLTEQERELISKSADKNELKLFYPDGKVKYEAIIKGPKDHITCYASTGKKCKEIFSNSRTKIKKTIYFDPEGKKAMVCKGSIKY